MKLTEDLHSIDNKLLVKNGEKITRWTLQKIVNHATDIQYIRVKDTFLNTDFKKALQDKRYKTILEPDKQKRQILRTIQDVTVPKKVIAELQHMKKTYFYTYRHILMVTVMGTKIALDKNLNGEYDPHLMARACIVHDIGKSRLSEAILNKASPLTREERKILKNHPLIGFILLHHYYGRNHDKCDFASYEHHERLDGSGYPRQLKKVNKYSQPIAVVDMFDALISVRPYRKIPYTLRAALDFLLDDAYKKKINKKMALLLVCYARRDKPSIKNLKVSKERRDKPPINNMWGKTAKK